MDATTNTVNIDGTTLAYREHGDGEPVVFVHGAVSDLRTWTAQLEGIGGPYRAVAYNGRYSGEAARDPSPGERPIITHVADLAAFLRAIDAAPAHLVGNSSGALVCLLTAIRHPELVRTLALEEPPAMTLFVSPRPRPRELLALLVRRPRTAAAIVRMGAGALAPAEKAFRRGDDEAGMERFVRGVLGREHAERLSEGRRRQARENLAEIKATLVRAALPPLHEDEVRRVRQPTLLVVGEESTAFAARLTERLEELLPRATRFTVPGASHFAHEDNPAAVNAALRAFLNGREPPRAAAA